ncbi:MAG: twin-arginine translocation signal domain-containing protein, partial [Chthoniobacterales bacterium]
MEDTQRFHNDSDSDGVSRRAFLGTTIGGGAALLTGGLASLFPSSAQAVFADDSPWIEANIPKLQRLMRFGALTSRALTQSYLKRIAELNP